MKATIKHNDEILLADVVVHLREGEARGLKTWSGYFTQPSPFSLEPDAYRIELSDGRSGDIIVNRVTEREAYFVGSGELN